MRHKISGNKLGRNQSLRKATVRDLAKATLIEQRICTTKAKAKEARKLVDKLITLGKKGTLAHKRRAFATLCDHKLVSNLFTTIAPRFANRSGGYTRIIPYTNRRGDNAEMAFLELTEMDKEIITQASGIGLAEEAPVVDAQVADVPEAEESKEEAKSSKKPTATKASDAKEAAKPTKEQKTGSAKKLFSRRKAS